MNSMEKINVVSTNYNESKTTGKRMNVEYQSCLKMYPFDFRIYYKHKKYCLFVVGFCFAYNFNYIMNTTMNLMNYEIRMTQKYQNEMKKSL